MEQKSVDINYIISVIFHPIIYPLIATFIYLYYAPKYIYEQARWIMLGLVFFGTIILPLILLLILKLTNQIESLQLHKITERKYPFIIFTIIALMLSRVFFKMDFTYDLGVYYIAGAMSFLTGYWFLFFHKKISIHTMGLGNLTGFIMQLSLYYQLNFLVLIAFLFLLFGVVSQARIKMRAHTLGETILGFVLGIIPQLILPYLYQNI